MTEKFLTSSVAPAVIFMKDASLDLKNRYIHIMPGSWEKGTRMLQQNTCVIWWTFKGLEITLILLQTFESNSTNPHKIHRIYIMSMYQHSLFLQGSQGSYLSKCQCSSHAQFLSWFVAVFLSVIRQELDISGQQLVVQLAGTHFSKWEVSSSNLSGGEELPYSQKTFGHIRNGENVYFKGTICYRKMLKRQTQLWYRQPIDQQ